MDSFLRAIGFGSKPDYAEKIPESLSPDDFGLLETFHHGYPNQPTCLEYDSVQQLLAVGTETGAVLLLGKPGLERYFKHPTPDAVLKMQFITNRGLLVTCCNNDIMYLWSLEEKEPKIIHTLDFTRENDKPTCLSHVYQSEWLYVGSKGGNVHIVHATTCLVSGLTVHWNQAVGPSVRAKPGHVLAVQEHPMDQGKILIAFNGGLCVLYNLKHHEFHNRSRTDSKQSDHRTFSFDPGNNHIITSVCWINCGRHFSCSYSDGSIVVWNPKSETKPEKVFYLHESDPSQFKPIYKMQVIHTDSDPMYMCSGGFPEMSDEAPRTLTVMHGKSVTMLSCDSTIIDFLCLPSSPHPCDHQKPFALVIIAKNEIVFHDLSTPGYPKFPCYSLPYAVDIHLPAVSFIHYSALCSEEFIAQLHSVKSKMMTTSTKAWPLNGGRWGEEVPHSSSDVIITGHVDGSVRLWHCNSVIFQPFFTVETSRYFKRAYSESPTKTPPSKSPASSSKSSPTTSQNSPSQQKASPSVSPPSRPPPPKHPPPKSKRASDMGVSSSSSTTPSTPSSYNTASNSSLCSTCTNVSSSSNTTLEPSDDQRSLTSSNNTEEPSPPPVYEGKSGAASPATGQVHAMEKSSSVEEVDGVLERKTISSYKSKKKRKKSKSALFTPVEGEGHDLGRPSSPSPSGKKKLSQLGKKSFHKLARAAKLGRSSSSSSEKAPSIDEVDEGNDDVIPEENEEEEREEFAVVQTPTREPEQVQQQQQLPRKKRPPPRPKAITLAKQDSQLMENTPMVTVTPSWDINPYTSAFQEEGEGSSQQHEKRRPVPQPRQYKDVTRSRQSPHRLTTKVRTRTHPQADEEFFVINYVHMCVCGLWLCVANNGGNVMAFSFNSKPSKQSRPAGFLDVNFDYDSIKKQYSPSTSTPQDKGRPPVSPAVWTYDNRINDSSIGYQMTQLCRCFYTSVEASESDASHIPPPTTPPPISLGEAVGVKLPVTVNEIQFSTDRGLLAIATGRGFALVDTHSNTCIYTLSCSISILYLSDPSKFTTQMKKESSTSVVAHPSIKRHGTSIRFSDHTRPTLRTTQSMDKDHADKGKEGACESMLEVSVELESCVSTLELIQLPMDKTGPPTLTLWVGLASGYVAAYIVNTVNKAAKRFELVPTRMLIETGKSPVVNLFFLNEWGDRQVAPFNPDHQHSGSPPPSPLPSTQHYAIFVDEQKIKSYIFPGFAKINSVPFPMKEDNVILRSEYFSCNDLPCLATVTSCQHLYIHSLPGLKPLSSFPLGSLGNHPQTMGTFRVSGNGHGLYMSSASEIQRLSIVKDNMLNFPGCLPSVHTKRPDVSPASKGFLGALFSAGPSTINREELFGEEGSRHPIGDIARVDGKITRAYGTRKGRLQDRSQDGGAAASAPRDDRERDRSHRGRPTTRRTLRDRGGGGGGGGGGAGLSNQMNRNISALDERKKKLTEIEDRTAKVSDNASEFSDLAALLVKKYERK